MLSLISLNTNEGVSTLELARAMAVHLDVRKHLINSASPIDITGGSTIEDVHRQLLDSLFTIMNAVDPAIASHGAKQLLRSVYGLNAQATPDEAAMAANKPLSTLLERALATGEVIPLTSLASIVPNQQELALLAKYVHGIMFETIVDPATGSRSYGFIMLAAPLLVKLLFNSRLLPLGRSIATSPSLHRSLTTLEIAELCYCSHRQILKTVKAYLESEGDFTQASVFRRHSDGLDYYQLPPEYAQAILTAQYLPFGTATSDADLVTCAAAIRVANGHKRVGVYVLQNSVNGDGSIDMYVGVCNDLNETMRYLTEKNPLLRLTVALWKQESMSLQSTAALLRSIKAAHQNWATADGHFCVPSTLSHELINTVAYMIQLQTTIARLASQDKKA